MPLNFLVLPLTSVAPDLTQMSHDNVTCHFLDSCRPELGVHRNSDPRVEELRHMRGWPTFRNPPTSRFS